MCFCCAKVRVFIFTYRPEVESKNMRFKMITEHKNVIGQSRAFDGAILYLPIKITEKVSDMSLLHLYTQLNQRSKEASCLLFCVGTEAHS